MEIHFILSKPAVEENIGAAARAIKTMGFTSLRLISPASHLSMNARKLAHGSADILEKAQVFDNTTDALAGLDLIIGTTAKKRNIRQEYIPAHELSAFIGQKSNTIGSVGILFGREESGLSNEEISMCDILSYIPIVAPFPSLNLAQAVMVYAYELTSLSKRETISPEETDPQTYSILKEKVQILLPLLGLHKARPVYQRIMERIALAGKTDIHLLLSAVEPAIRKLERRGEKETERLSDGETKREVR